MRIEEAKKVVRLQNVHRQVLLKLIYQMACTETTPQRILSAAFEDAYVAMLLCRLEVAFKWNSGICCVHL